MLFENFLNLDVLQIPLNCQMLADDLNEEVNIVLELGVFQFDLQGRNGKNLALVVDVSLNHILNYFADLGVKFHHEFVCFFLKKLLELFDGFDSVEDAVLLDHILLDVGDDLPDILE